MKKTKKRNAQDLTLRNLRALKKRVEALEAIIFDLTGYRIKRKAVQPKRGKR